MKKWYRLLLLLITATSILLAWQDSEKYGNLTVIVEGIETNDGQVLIALNNSEENYENKKQAFRGITVNIIDLKATFTFENLPYGIYAIKTYHDQNSNRELDTNFMGMPIENYGFSNNARGTFGPASWEDAKFRFEVQTDTLRIRIQ